MDRASAPDRLRTWMASAVVVVAIAAAHGRAVTADFVAFDDDQYVFQNEHVQRGLAPASFAWAFELVHPRSYFHPLTWLSLMLDRTLPGPGAWGFHLVNVVLHAAVAVLLLLVLARTTGQLWASLGAALLFGVHPLTVEAVAWVSERKTVLSAALGMATVAALALASLLAKPGLVVLPILLLLLDVWPLRRIGVPPGPRSEPGLAR